MCSSTSSFSLQLRRRPLFDVAGSNWRGRSARPASIIIALSERASEQKRPPKKKKKKKKLFVFGSVSLCSALGQRECQRVAKFALGAHLCRRRPPLCVVVVVVVVGAIAAVGSQPPVERRSGEESERKKRTGTAAAKRWLQVLLPAPLNGGSGCSGYFRRRPVRFFIFFLFVFFSAASRRHFSSLANCISHRQRHWHKQPVARQFHLHAHKLGMGAAVAANSESISQKSAHQWQQR